MELFSHIVLASNPWIQSTGLTEIGRDAFQYDFCRSLTIFKAGRPSLSI